MNQIKWKRIGGTLTPLYRTELGGQWLRCDQHSLAATAGNNCTQGNRGMVVFVRLQKQGFTVLPTEEF